GVLRCHRLEPPGHKRASHARCRWCGSWQCRPTPTRMVTSSADGCSRRWTSPGAASPHSGRGADATVAVDGMVFHEPVFVGDEVSCYGEVIRTGRTSMTVRIEAWRRHLPSDEVRKVTEAVFTYVAIDENRRPRPLPPAA